MRDQGSSADFVLTVRSQYPIHAQTAPERESLSHATKEFQMRLNLSTVLSVSTVVAVAAPASAALTLTNFEITASRISFNLSGTITAQQAGNNEIRIVDNADDFWTLQGLTPWTAVDRFLDSYSGPSLSIGSSSLYRVDTRRFGSGSSIVMFFNQSFVQGASVSGTFSFDAPAAGGIFSSPAQQFINLENRSFKAGIGGVAFATDLGNPVPAPGAIALLGLAGLAGRRRR